MKILVLSLLRMGDVVMHMQIIRQIKKQFAGSEIHLVVNSQFSGLETLFGDEVKFIYFNRESLQQKMGEDKYSMFQAFGELSLFLSRINEEQFDRVYNLTHSRLSALLLDLMVIPEKIGVHYENGKTQGINNGWISFYNDYYSENNDVYFHSIQALAKALGLENPVPKSTQVSLATAQNIYLQVQTSDTKKNWLTEEWRSLISRLQSDKKNVTILGAPNEEQDLKSQFGDLNCEIKIFSLTDAEEVLTQADLLITLDTGIKHLAAEYGVPVVELCFGSSNWQKTSVFQGGAVVMTSTVACSPCAHRRPCPYGTRSCAQSLSADDVIAFLVNENADEFNKSNATGFKLSVDSSGHLTRSGGEAGFDYQKNQKILARNILDFERAKLEGTI